MRLRDFVKKIDKKVIIIAVLIISVLVSSVAFALINKKSLDTDSGAALQRGAVAAKRTEVLNDSEALLNSIYSTSLTNMYDKTIQVNKGKTDLEVAEHLAEKLCSNTTKLTPSSVSAFQLQNCGAGHIVYANHFLRLYQKSPNNTEYKKWANWGYYMQLVYLDMAATGPEYDLISGIKFKEDQKKWKLRDDYNNTRYISDSSGFYASLGWGKESGLMQQSFCTPLEIPFDKGKNCKTIDMYQRLRQVSAAIAAKIANEFVIKPDGSLRTEYWNQAELDKSAAASKPYFITTNTTYNPSAGIGFADLLGRKTSSSIPQTMPMDPYFFSWMASGLANTAALASNGNDIYHSIHQFAANAASYMYAIDPNTKNMTVANEYGYPLKGLITGCTGKVNTDVKNLLDYCTNGNSELLAYKRDANDVPCFTCFGYNAQHLGGVLADLDWNNLPQYMHDNALLFYDVYKANTTLDGHKLIDFNNGAVNYSLMKGRAPSKVKDSCRVQGENYAYYRNPSTGKLVTSTGELASELVITALPPLITVVEQVDSNKAIEMLNDYKAMLGAIRKSPLKAEDVRCGGTNWVGTTNDASLLFHYNNLLYAHLALAKNRTTKISTFSKPDTNLSKSDTNGQSILRTSVNTKNTLPDGIQWNSWVEDDLIKAGFPKESFPLSTREVFIGGTTWYDSITKGDKGWNRTGSTLTSLTKAAFSPQGGLSLSGAGFPESQNGYNTRVIYQDFSGGYVEGLTKGPQAWIRTIPTWFKPNAWSKVTDNLQKAGYPKEFNYAEGRSVYIVNNSVMMDIWIQGDTVWYRTANKSLRFSGMTRMKLSALGLPAGPAQGVDTLVVFQDPSTKTWYMSVTKGTKGWTRSGKYL